MPTLPWAPEYQGACSDFLSRVEQGEIHAVTSDFVLNEGFDALLVGKGSELLASTRIARIKKQSTQDATLSAACYKVCLDFWGNLTVLQTAGLGIVSISAHEQEASLRLGSQYPLLPTDALHVATCQQRGIRHCRRPLGGEPLG